MRNLFILLLILSPLVIRGQELPLDIKYVKVGYLTNYESKHSYEKPGLPEFGRNDYLRYLGHVNYKYSYEPKEMARKMTQEGLGEWILYHLLSRDKVDLDMSDLYETALSNVALSEDELAELNTSGEKKDILKKEIAKQLLKNNYIILIAEREKAWYWQVYHVDINNNIIDQAYLNWNNPSGFAKIQVPISFIAEGKTKYPTTTLIDERNLRFDIGKKVVALAPRGRIISCSPFHVDITNQMNVQPCDRMGIYRFKEDKKGKLKTQKIAEARVHEVTDSYSKLVTISGRSSSIEKGDFAVVLDSKKRYSLTFDFQGSFGNDYRYGGRAMFDMLGGVERCGISHHALVGLEYNTYNKEPDNVWFNEDGISVNPRLSNTNFVLGYGLGYNFLCNFQIMPYVLIGGQLSIFSNEDARVWVNETNSWQNTVFDRDTQSAISFVGYLGANLKINLFGPIALNLGADYNLYLRLTKPYKYIYRQHTLNRLNAYAGFCVYF